MASTLVAASSGAASWPRPIRRVPSRGLLQDGGIPAPVLRAKYPTYDPVHVRRRVTTIDGVINQSADSYFAVATAERNPGLLTGQGAGGRIARINAVPPVTEVQEEITARMPSSPEAARLDIPEGTPVFDVIRTCHTADGALDVARFIIRAGMASFDYRFPAPD